MSIISHNTSGRCFSFPARKWYKDERCVKNFREALIEYKFPVAHPLTPPPLTHDIASSWSDHLPLNRNQETASNRKPCRAWNLGAEEVKLWGEAAAELEEEQEAQMAPFDEIEWNFTSVLPVPENWKEMDPKGIFHSWEQLLVLRHLLLLVPWTWP